METIDTDDPIVAAAIEYRRKGEDGPHILTGRRHADIINEFYRMRLSRAERDMSAERQGFVTRSGRFVDREEAMAIARACEQLKFPVPEARTELFSEDLW